LIQKRWRFWSKWYFSPAGTNIDAGKLHVKHAWFYVMRHYGAQLQWRILMLVQHLMFFTPRYAELVENQSCMQNQTIPLFVDGMEIFWWCVLPSGKVTAESITQKWKQWWSPKNLLGKNKCDKKIYRTLSFKHDPNRREGFWSLRTQRQPRWFYLKWCLENLLNQWKMSFHMNFFISLHHWPFILKKSIILIIIHQKMSEHLWMYEGVTEYFAIFFKSIRLIPEEEFYSWPKDWK
jgi:hypothetical protein